MGLPNNNLATRLNSFPSTILCLTDNSVSKKIFLVSILLSFVSVAYHFFCDRFSCVLGEFLRRTQLFVCVCVCVVAGAGLVKMNSSDDYLPFQCI